MGSRGERRWVSEDARFARFIPIGRGQLPLTRTSNSGGLPPPPGFLPKKYRGVRLLPAPGLLRGEEAWHSGVCEPHHLEGST